MTVKTPEVDELHRQCGNPVYVTETLRFFRQKLGVTVKEAGYILGVPARTLEGVEQGREFPYPALLVKCIYSLMASLPVEHETADAEVRLQASETGHERL